ncbi:MAG TPA: lysylphosphatidylglycerol synthase transmembrane domain-containing protein [Chloroflexia bacterium]|nr:lysylphosphatidylglycerol synthase transmembrane domain-containing protein [Chloroflexia bacterium]
MDKSQRPTNSFFKIGLGLLVSGVCLYFVLRGVDWSEVWAHLTEVNLPIFMLAMLLMLAAYFLMSWRWKRLLDPLEVSQDGESRSATGHVSLLNLYGKTLTGYFFNAFFPARAGDIVRAYLLGKRTGLRKTTVLATIVIEKAFDGIVLLLMLLVSLVLLPSVISTPGSFGVSPDLLAWVAGVALVAAVAGLVLFYLYSARFAQLVGSIFGKLPLPERLKRLPVRLIKTFAEGMHVFRNPRPLISAALISTLVWVVAAFMLLAGLLSFKSPFPAELTGVVGLLFMTALVNLGLLIPALPGNVGTYEALIVAGMAFFRVDKELAVAFALIFHAGQLVTTLLVGVVAFWMQNLSLREMGAVEDQAEREAETLLYTEPGTETTI